MNLNKISRRNFLCAAGLTTAARPDCLRQLRFQRGRILCRRFLRSRCRTGGAHRLCRRLPH